MDGRDAKRSEELFRKASRCMPGGVNSPVRAFRSVGGTPPFIASASGCKLVDADGREYIDYVGSFGPMILGHAYPQVVSAICEAASRGTSYGAPTEAEVELAELICSLVPSLERVRLVNSGTEAAMSALRLARAFSGRPMFIKFDGCYHGHSDPFLVQAGSGVATLNLPDSPGVPPEFTAHTISLPYQDTDAVGRAFEKFSGRIAGVFLEPVAGNMGVVAPEKSFLARLFELAEADGALVVFDEVMTGFRLAKGGAQELFGLRPHLTCLGKIVGGGLPIGAFGGRKEIMSQLAPEGPVYQAGTLSGNPIAVSAGLATLRALVEQDPFERLERITADLAEGFREAAAANGVPIQVQACGSMFTVFFAGEPVLDFASAKKCDTRQFSRFFHGMLERGVYLAPSQFEACFVSTAHDSEAVSRTIRAAQETLALF
ncbi:MAG TPA: glutamate-1-semialdehyde 2,1-aminomutase [Acidobacteriota bacterium]|nr:glutamate-1-semialdehyde 2,1-aminomutase [Acidobacteriota bacterium]